MLDPTNTYLVLFLKNLEPFAILFVTSVELQNATFNSLFTRRLKVFYFKKSKLYTLNSFNANVQFLGWRWIFLNILRISALNVLKTSLNVIVSIECTFVIFHSHKPTGSLNMPYDLAATLASKQEIQ